MTSFKFTALRSLCMVSGLCLAMLTPSIASAMLIDDFTNFDLVSRAANQELGTTTGPLQVGLSGVINGGNRQVSVEMLSKTNTSSFNTTTLGIDGGQLFFGNSSGITGKFTAVYTNIGTVDASQPNSALSFDILNNDLAGGTLQLTLNDGMNSSSSNEIIPGSTFGKVSFIINPANYAGVNLAAVTSLTLMYTAAEQSGDFALEGGFNLTTVPEPSSLALVLTGLGMAGVYFRRRRKQVIA